MRAQGAAPEGLLAGTSGGGSIDSGNVETIPPAFAEVITADATCRELKLVAEINAEHQLAAGCAKEAVQHAIRCGELLTEQKKKLPHGEFSKWIKINCEFAYSTAARYMTAAKANLSGVEISSLAGLFPSGRKSERAPKALPPIPPHTPSASPPESEIETALKALTKNTMAGGGKYGVMEVSAVRSARVRVTKLQNQLIEARNDLARAEAQAIKAARELQE